VRGGGAEEAADPGAQGPRRGRLAETVDQGVVEEAGGYRAARHEQDRHPGVVVQDLTGEFRTGHHRHVDVGGDSVDAPLSGECVQRLPPVRGERHVIAAAGEAPPDAPAQFRYIVDDQNTRRRELLAAVDGLLHRYLRVAAGWRVGHRGRTGRTG